MNAFADLFEKTEDAHGLPTGILRAIAMQESSLYPWASKWEPDFFLRYINDRPRAELGGFWPPLRYCDEVTERRNRATSFGLIQIMGQVARELRFSGNSLLELCRPEIGVEYGARHLAKKLKKYPRLEDGLSAYNAGIPSEKNRKSYVLPILARMGRA